MSSAEILRGDPTPGQVASARVVLQGLRRRQQHVEAAEIERELRRLGEDVELAPEAPPPPDPWDGTLVGRDGVAFDSEPLPEPPAPRKFASTFSLEALLDQGIRPTDGQVSAAKVRIAALRERGNTEEADRQEALLRSLTGLPNAKAPESEADFEVLIAEASAKVEAAAELPNASGATIAAAVAAKRALENRRDIWRARQAGQRRAYERQREELAARDEEDRRQAERDEAERPAREAAESELSKSLEIVWELCRVKGPSSSGFIDADAPGHIVAAFKRAGINPYTGAHLIMSTLKLVVGRIP